MSLVNLSSARLALVASQRCLSTSASNPMPVHPVYFKHKETQKKFQANHHLRVHLKGGPKDKILYNFTLLLTAVTMGMTLQFFYKSIFPPKPE